jgi:ectoine hydroxylase-related dioxygenase (phytanoyl-CoA dioxygenase family)
VANVLSREEMFKARNATDDSVAFRSRAGVRHALRVPAFEEIAKQPKLMDLARAALGPSAFPYRATLFDKSQKSNWLVVWHQDTALPVCEKCDTPGWGPWSVKDSVTYAHAPAAVLAQVLALRVHLDDSTSENGPLRVLPRTHELGVLDDDGLYSLSNKTDAVDCQVAAGGIIARKPLLVHASSKSRSSAPRRVLHIEYAAHEAIAAPSCVGHYIA